MPETIYRYRSFENFVHLNTLTLGKFWFSHADYFNDPFDLNWGYDYSGSREKKNKWALSFLEREKPQLSLQERIDIAEKQIDELESNPEELRQRAEGAIQMNKDRFGVCCFSSARDDILMWSHYSNHHTGFCIGIDYSVLAEIQESRAKYNKELLDIVEVEYSESIPHINFFDSMLSKHGSLGWMRDLEKFISTKSSHWKYEREYRLVLWNQTNTAYLLGVEPISEVLLGCRISRKNKNLILGIVDSKSTPIKVYQCNRHESRFELTIDRIR